MSDGTEINLNLTTEEEFNLALANGAESMSIGLTEGMIIISSSDYYTGELMVTPSSEEQTLPTLGKVMPGNVTVGPVPSNYGLITWDGTVLTVS